MDLKIGDNVILIPIEGRKHSQNRSVLSLLKKDGPNIVFKIVAHSNFDKKIFKVKYGDKINPVSMENWNFIKYGIKYDVFTLPEELFIL